MRDYGIYVLVKQSCKLDLNLGMWNRLIEIGRQELFDSVHIIYVMG